MSVSVSLRSVRVMSGQRFRRTSGGVCSLRLHLVWCPKYQQVTVNESGTSTWEVPITPPCAKRC